MTARATQATRQQHRVSDDIPAEEQVSPYMCQGLASEICSTTEGHLAPDAIERLITLLTECRSALPHEHDLDDRIMRMIGELVTASMPR